MLWFDSSVLLLSLVQVNVKNKPDVSFILCLSAFGELIKLTSWCVVRLDKTWTSNRATNHADNVLQAKG